MESSLSDAYVDLLGSVGHYLGYGRGPHFGDQEWNQRQKGIIDLVVKSGLRQFYFPPPMEGERTVYEWSFLRPSFNPPLRLVVGRDAVALPDDYGGLIGTLSLRSSNRIGPFVTITSEALVRVKHAELTNSSGAPRMAAIRPKKGVGETHGQRFELYVFPTADDVYEIDGAYHILPDYLSGTKPYAYGGAQHAETILQSCLAIAEQRLDDAAQVHTMKFRERLAASIGIDSRNKPQDLGYNGDSSDEYRRQDVRDLRRTLYNGSRVTYNGM